MICYKLKKMDAYKMEKRYKHRPYTLPICHIYFENKLYVSCTIAGNLPYNHK